METAVGTARVARAFQWIVIKHESTQTTENRADVGYYVRYAACER